VQCQYAKSCPEMVLMKADGAHIFWLHICHRWCPIHEALVCKVVRLHEPEDPFQVRGLEACRFLSA
jgi:hypothetical protein